MEIQIVLSTTHFFKWKYRLCYRLHTLLNWNTDCVIDYILYISYGNTDCVIDYILYTYYGNTDCVIDYTLF